MTTTLRLTPFVLKLPVRPPVLVAKQASSLAFLSDNRLGLGVGLSPVARGLRRRSASPWEKRGKRMDECMDILRGLTTGEFFGYDGEFYAVRRRSSSAPAPTEQIPLLVGGHADAALRRAVLKGDGWMHAGGDGEELDRLLARLAEIRKAEGDTRDDFEVHVISYDAYDLDGVKRLEDKGVTDCIVGFRVPYIKGPDTEPLEKKIEHLERYAESIIAKVDAVSELDLDRAPFTDAIAEAEELIAQRRRSSGTEQDLAEGYDYLAGRIRIVAADGLRLRPRPAGADQPDPPVLPAGPRQPGRDLLQRLPARGRRVRRPRRAAAPPPTCPSR